MGFIFVEFAEISGARPPPGADNHKMRSVSHRTLGHDNEALHDPSEDDDIIHIPFSSSSASRDSGDTARGGAIEIVRPTITLHAENPSVARQADPHKKQHLTCMVTIEMPSKWAAPALPDQERARSGSTTKVESLPPPPPPRSDSYSSSNPHHSTSSDPSANQHLRPTSPSRDSIQDTYAYGSTLPATGEVDSPPSNPFSVVVEDLQARIVDWKGHSPDEFGSLKLFDYIHVRKEKNVREFLVYVSPSRSDIPWV